MASIKIVSNPYLSKIEFQEFKNNQWINIKDTNPNSKLREIVSNNTFLPFKISEILEQVISDYYVEGHRVDVIFQGVQDEFNEIKKLYKDPKINTKINLIKDDSLLENGRDIIKHIKDYFEQVKPVIEELMEDEEQVKKGLGKITDALEDIVPICVFGNYSSGKSTFINSLIGYEVLPSGGDPVTAKVYKINKSEYDDRANIRFKFVNEDYEIDFRGEKYEIICGNKESDIMKELQPVLDSTEIKSMLCRVHEVLGIINYFEKRDKEVIEIGSVIEVEVPFNEDGILGKSSKKFMIFDTPGSNSASNLDHKEVLVEAMDGLSNGIPVWVTNYQAIDTVDNANLVKMIYDIEALDNRFTMIVVNKADQEPLPRDGWSEKDVRNIMEYDSVDKMYSSGIYFVSAIMGLGSKNYAGITDEFAIEIFEEKETKFSDKNAKSYKRLFDYNIMPKQFKIDAILESENCDNLIYANSGIYCVEKSMETFAGKFASYNKCQMVYLFLDDVIEKTKMRVESKIASLQKMKQKRELELGEETDKLLKKIEKESSTTITNYNKESKNDSSNFVKNELDYSISAEKLDEDVAEISKQKSDEREFSREEKKVDNAEDTLKNHLIEGKNKLKFDNLIPGIKDMAETFIQDTKDYNKSRKEKNEVKRQIDRDTSDKLIEIVKNEYKKSINGAKRRLEFAFKEYWHTRASNFKQRLIKVVTMTDVLSSEQQSQVSDLILSYEDLKIEDDSVELFIKSKFLRGRLFGINFLDDEIINTNLLSKKYNTRIFDSTKEMASKINDSYFECFKVWAQNLQTLIEEDITSINPDLKELAEEIAYQEKRINKMEDNQQLISNSYNAINEMMSWQIKE